MVNVLDVEGVVLGGGLGIRLGHPYAARIAEAMQPHLFADSRPPHVHVAALGDLGGAIGAALLVRAGAVTFKEQCRSQWCTCRRSCAARCLTARASGSGAWRT